MPASHRVITFSPAIAIVLLLVTAHVFCCPRITRTDANPLFPSPVLLLVPVIVLVPVIMLLLVLVIVIVIVLLIMPVLSLVLVSSQAYLVRHVDHDYDHDHDYEQEQGVHGSPRLPGR